jgi:hypothetical protein
MDRRPYDVNGNHDFAFLNNRPDAAWVALLTRTFRNQAAESTGISRPVAGKGRKGNLKAWLKTRAPGLSSRARRPCPQKLVLFAFKAT